MNDRALPVKMLALCAMMLVVACSGAAKKSPTSAAATPAATTAASKAPSAPSASKAPSAPSASKAPSAPSASKAPVAGRASAASAAPVASKASAAPVASKAPVAPVAGKAPVAPVASKAPVAAPVANAGDGAKIYSANCSSCHGATGKGTAMLFPPLAGNPTLTGDPTKVISIVKYGSQGRIVVAGSAYSGQMPAWKGTLSDANIASVISFVRSAWGNAASAVSTAQVSAVAK